MRQIVKMKERVSLFLLVLISVSSFSQIKESPLYKIDSIAQLRWKKTNLDLDSLENAPILKIDEKKRQDTIFVPDEVEVSIATRDVPITPFHLMKYQAPNRWFFFGQNNLIFNQSSFSNWNSGGNDNISVIGKINYTLNYKNNKHYLENNLQMGYGFLAAKDQATRKTDDYINLSSNYGYELGGNYYLSAGFQVLTQFSEGYDYNATPDPKKRDRISSFMAPGYLNIGVGLSYNPNENFQVIFRPINGKFTFVLDEILQKQGKYGLERDGQSVRSELGAMLNFIYRIKFHKNVTFDNQLGFFSNYLYHSERVDIAYAGVLNVKFNKFINMTVGLDLVYDHDQVQHLQRKQTLGIGFIYNMGTESKEKTNKKKFVKPFVVK